MEEEEGIQVTKMEKRKRMTTVMEATNGGAGEVRKVNVVYFISRGGEVEHPHLIRIHHIRRDGVRLRDVKRWLSELRGKDMPNSFSWSYKRQYKSGYVWQDLTDDELITPISNNEYILKGSELGVKTDIHPPDMFPCCGKTSNAARHNLRPESPVEGGRTPSPKSSPEMPPNAGISFVTPLRIDQESPHTPPPPTSRETSDDSLKRGATVKMNFSVRQVQAELKPEAADKKSTTNNNTMNSSSGHRSNQTASRTKAKRVFRNLMQCKIVDTSDSSLRPVRRSSPVMDRQMSLDVKAQRRRSFGGGGTPYQPHRQSSGQGYARKSWSTKSEGRRSTRKAGEKVPAMYKPAAEPNCSQCGSPFKPEKLHSHMKSCRVLREKRRNSKSMEKMPARTETHNSREDAIKDFSKEAAEEEAAAPQNHQIFIN